MKRIFLICLLGIAISFGYASQYSTNYEESKEIILSYVSGDLKQDIYKDLLLLESGKLSGGEINDTLVKISENLRLSPSFFGERGLLDYAFNVSPYICYLDTYYNLNSDDCEGFENLLKYKDAKESILGVSETKRHKINIYFYKIESGIYQENITSDVAILNLQSIVNELRYSNVDDETINTTVMPNICTIMDIFQISSEVCDVQNKENLFMPEVSNEHEEEPYRPYLIAPFLRILGIIATIIIVIRLMLRHKKKSLKKSSQ